MENYLKVLSQLSEELKAITQLQKEVNTPHEADILEGKRLGLLVAIDIVTKV